MTLISFIYLFYVVFPKLSKIKGLGENTTRLRPDITEYS